MKSRLLLMLIFSILFSCSSDESDDITAGEENDSLNYLKKMTGQESDGDPYELQILYENNKISKMANKANDGNVYYSAFELNAQNKILKTNAFYRFDNAHIIDFDNPENFEGVASVFQYGYQNNKLIERSIDYNNEIFSEYFDYNNNGDFEKYYCSESENNSCETRILTYDQGQITSLFICYYCDGDGLTYTFEFDDKINPFYVLFQKYGLPLGKAIGLENMGEYRGDFFYKNNIKKLYINGELHYTASYQYNSNGYPTTANYQYVTYGRSGSAVFVYE